MSKPTTDYAALEATDPRARPPQRNRPLNRGDGALSTSIPWGRPWNQCCSAGSRAKLRMAEQQYARGIPGRSPTGNAPSEQVLSASPLRLSGLARCPSPEAARGRSRATPPHASQPDPAVKCIMKSTERESGIQE